MIFETSRQARFIIPMALSLGYGILFATAISLILVPCLYLLVEDIRKLFRQGEKPLVPHSPILGKTTRPEADVVPAAK